MDNIFDSSSLMTWRCFLAGDTMDFLLLLRLPGKEDCALVLLMKLGFSRLLSLSTLRQVDSSILVDFSIFSIYLLNLEDNKVFLFLALSA